MAVAAVVRVDRRVFLPDAARADAGRQHRAAVLVEAHRAAVLRKAGNIVESEVGVQVPAEAAADVVAVAVDPGSAVAQRRPVLLARTRGLHQVGARGAAVGEVFVGDVPAQVGIDLPQQADAGGGLVLGAVFLVADHVVVRVDRAEGCRVAAGGHKGGLLVRERHAGEFLVIDVAVVLLVHDRKAQGCVIGQRHVEGAARAVALVVADAALDIAGTAVQGRLHGLDVHRADRRVAAPEGALRTAQYFDALDVEQQGGRAFGARRIHVVDERGDFRIGVLGLGAVVTDAAQGHGGDAMVALGGGLEARHQGYHVEHGLDVVVGQGGGGERGDGHRGLLQRGVALGCGDAHFGDDVGVGSGGLRHCSGGVRLRRLVGGSGLGVGAGDAGQQGQDGELDLGVDVPPALRCKGFHGCLQCGIIDLCVSRQLL